MTLDEIRHHIEIEAEMFIKPQSKAVFKKTIEPYFQEVSAFKKNLDVYVLELKKAIDKYLEKNTKSKFLDMDNSPGKDYIKCSNHTPTPPYLDVYYPEREYGHIWGWIPQKAYKNDPLGQLLSYANWPEPEKQNLTMFQFAMVAILHDAPNIENGCNLIYFGSGDDLADRVALEFMNVIVNDENREIKTPFARAQGKRVIYRLKNAFDTVKIKLGDNETDLAKLPAETGQENKKQDTRTGGDTYNINAKHVSLGDNVSHAGRDINTTTSEQKKKKGAWVLIKKISLILGIIVSLIVIVGTCNKDIRKNKPAIEQTLNETPKTEPNNPSLIKVNSQQGSALIDGVKMTAPQITFSSETNGKITITDSVSETKGTKIDVNEGGRIKLRNGAVIDQNGGN